MNHNDKQHYYSVIRMQPSGMRGEIINIGIMVFDRENKRHMIELLPSDHPKIQSVALKGLSPFDFNLFIEMLTESVKALDNDEISPFEKDVSVHDGLQDIHFLADQKFLMLTPQTPIRLGANLESTHQKLMDVYVK